MGPVEPSAVRAASPWATALKPAARVAGLTDAAAQNCTVLTAGIDPLTGGMPVLSKVPVVDAGVIQASLEPSPAFTTTALIAVADANVPPVAEVADSDTTLAFPAGSTNE